MWLSTHLPQFYFFFPYVSPKKSPGFHAGRSVFCATKYPSRKLYRAYLAPASKSQFLIHVFFWCVVNVIVPPL